MEIGKNQYEKVNKSKKNTKKAIDHAKCEPEKNWIVSLRDDQNLKLLHCREDGQN